MFYINSKGNYHVHRGAAERDGHVALLEEPREPEVSCAEEIKSIIPKFIQVFLTHSFTELAND